MRTVIGGVGYRNLRDHSLGIVMSDELEPLADPPALLIEDLCYGPVAVGQWFLDEAMKNDWLLVLDHEPGNPLQRVRADGKGWYKLIAESN